jgi:predicted DNA-binding protein
VRWLTIEKNVGGRPKLPPEVKHSERLQLRLTAAEQERLDYCVQHTGLSKSDIVRQGIDTVYLKLQEDSGGDNH